ncbi:MAG TPA: leucine--tRNA ligase [Actinomycetota bacterium]|nr:leucine--tRNA ligase [Actinomycetota bacterium]
MTAGTARYDPSEIEPKWRARWAADRLWELNVEGTDGPHLFYNLVEFPYPSAEGLHVGHAYTYSGADTYGRLLRMRGRDVFQPIGFDSFGIHTENYALRVGDPPRTLTERTIANYRRQLRALGGAWDWSRELSTSDPAYYRWTQWIFVQLYRAGLAVRREAPVVWCPSCLTVLANEQLEGDRCERCGTRVEQRTMLQWFLRMTAYAQDLLEGLDDLDWPEPAKQAQRAWIGRSEGVEIDFAVPDRGLTLRTFTTRPDTLFGVTFLVVPPEHPDLDALVHGADSDAARRYAGEALRGRATTVTRGAGPSRSSRGAFTGSHALHPMTADRIPIYVAEYVLASYGTGAVMGVPAHDERDLRFAEAHHLPVIHVVRPVDPMAPSDGPWTGEGVLVDSGGFSGLASVPACDAIADRLEERGAGRRAVRYRLRDWLISRQRYWGPPIPIVYCDGCGTVAVNEEDLPVLLPDVEEFRPTGTGVSPLAAVESFVRTACPSCGGPARRETDVSDTFLDSAWYFLRYPSTDVHDRPWDLVRTERLLPVDSYAGGPEHITRHHLYARFITRALHDLGLLPFAEPFPRLLIHGMLTKDGAKMSKSRGNVVNPDRSIAQHGADVTRMYLLFIGPWDEGGDYSEAGVAGIERFLQRVWRLVTGPQPSGQGGVELRPLDRAIAQVGADLERMRFNTAIATLMELVRWARHERARMSPEEWRRLSRSLVLLLAPLAPHLAEELWSRIGGEYSVHRQPWPQLDPEALVPERVTLVVQVDGKTRHRFEVPAGTDQDRALELALESENVRRHLTEEGPAEVVFVADRLINLVNGRGHRRGST